jgi:FAD/FMN-containing dehydrogenase
MPSEPGEPGRRVPAAALATLRSNVQGSVVCPGEDDYAETRSVWNRDVQRQPAVIVRCTRVDDIANTVRFARSQNLPLAVRGGGYSPAGMSTSDGVVADLRPMRSVRVDPLGRTAVVGAGATWGSVDIATQRHGFAIPGVPVSHIGVAGSTIGGGFGHLRRAYGLACDNLIGAELVTAESERIVTSGDERPELLWGLRGGGGNFGVVTSLRFQLRPLPEPVLSGPIFYAAAHAPAVLRFYRDYTARLREDVTTRFSLFSAPHSAMLAQALARTGSEPVVSITVACVGHPDDAERLVRPVRAAAPVLVDRLARQPYVQLQASPDDAYSPGQHAAMTSAYVDELDDELIAALCERHAQMPYGSFELHVHHMGGAVGRVARMSTAVPNRAARYLISAMSRWHRREDETPARQWLQDTGERIRAFAVGGPHVGLQSAPTSSVDAYGAERYLRLAALKRRFDPDNVFAANQNVMPLA